MEKNGHRNWLRAQACRRERGLSRSAAGDLDFCSYGRGRAPSLLNLRFYQARKLICLEKRWKDDFARDMNPNFAGSSPPAPRTIVN